MRNVTCAAWITAAIRRALVVGSRVRVLLDLRAPMQRSASLGDMEQFFGEADLAHARHVSDPVSTRDTLHALTVTDMIMIWHCH